MTLIAFIGSVFSPYYKRARRLNPATEPLDHCAINIALYGRAGHRWAMTERRRGSVARDADSLAIGNSTLDWNRDGLTVSLDETTVPWPSPIRGCLRLHPTALAQRVESLAPGHCWRPIAASASVEVLLATPALRWTGHAYFDSNAGDTPIEDAMRRWHWSRSPLRDGGAALLYDLERRDGSRHALGLRVDRHGLATPFAAPATASLRRSAWHVDRQSRGDAAIVETLEDTPFYVRSTLAATLCGEATLGVHESLDLDRFSSPIVQWMLPFRMPRARR